MKTLPLVSPVAFTTPKGEPLKDEHGKQFVLTDFEFLIERTYDNGFAGDLKGYQQIVFTEAVRESLRKQMQAEVTVWSLEDAHYAAYRRHLETSSLDQSLLHNTAVFIRRFFE